MATNKPRRRRFGRLRMTDERGVYYAFGVIELGFLHGGDRHFQPFELASANSENTPNERHAFFFADYNSDIDYRQRFMVGLFIHARIMAVHTPAGIDLPYAIHLCILGYQIPEPS